MGQSIRGGIAWLFIGNTGNQVLNFGFGIILARLLAPEHFGVLVTIQIFTGMLSFVAGGGMGQALIRAREASKADYDAVLTLQLLIGLAIYTGLFFFAPVFARWYEEPSYEAILQVSALTFILRPFANLPGNMLHRQMRFKARSLAGLAVLIITNLATIGMALAGLEVWALILGGIVNALTNIAILIPVSGWRPGFTLQLARARGLMSYGLLTTIGDFIVYVRSQSTNFILSRTLGPADLGLFNKAQSLVTIPNTVVTGPVYQVIFRAIAREQDDMERGRYLFLKSLSLSCLYTWPFLFALAWLALPLVRFLYGDKWTGAATPMSWLGMVAPLIVLEQMAGAVLAARNWLHREIPVQIAQLCIGVLGAIAGLPHGLLGVTIGGSLAFIYGSLHLGWLAARCLELPYHRLFSAMVPAALLNAALLSTWAALDRVLAGPEELGDFGYLVIMSGSGAILYITLFLLLPFPELREERRKWLNKLGLGAAT